MKWLFVSKMMWRGSLVSQNCFSMNCLRKVRRAISTLHDITSSTFESNLILDLFSANQIQDPILYTIYSLIYLGSYPTGI